MKPGPQSVHNGVIYGFKKSSTTLIRNEIDEEVDELYQPVPAPSASDLAHLSEAEQFQELTVIASSLYWPWTG